MNLQGGFGAAAGAQSLEEILKQRFLEGEKRREGERAQQRDQQQASYQNESLGLQRASGERADARAAAADAAARRPIPVMGVGPGGMKPIGEAPAGTHFLNEPEPKPAPAPIPIRRVNPRTGKIDDLGDAPAGTHFLNEPAPPAPKDTSGREDRSYQYHATQLDKLRKPFDDVTQRLTKLHDTIAQGTPQADALVAPELMTVMAGGMGSGLRINEAEIARVIGGRSKWQDLQAAAQKWSLDPKSANSITPEQRQEIRALLTTVEDRVQKAHHTLDAAGDALVSSSDPQEHRRILNDAKKAITTINSTGGAATPAAQPHGGGVIRARDPQGNLHEAPAGTPLPAGWKPEG